MVEDRVEEGNGGIVERWNDGRKRMLRVAGYELKTSKE
jgi:hypothetical protein